MKRLGLMAIVLVAAAILTSFSAGGSHQLVVNPFGVKDPNVPSPYIKFGDDGIQYADMVQFCQ